MEIVLNHDCAPSPALRASTNGPTLHSGRPLLVACALAGRGDAALELEVSVVQDGQYHLEGLDGLGAHIVNEDFSFADEALKEVERFLKGRKPRIVFSKPVEPIRVQESLSLGSGPTICTISSDTWEPGNYRVELMGETRRPLFTDFVTVINSDLCVLRAVDLYCRSSYEPLDPADAELNVAALVARVVARRRSNLYARARESLLIGLKNGYSPTLSANRELLEGDVETILGYAESLIFAEGDISVELLPSHDSADFSIKVEVKPRAPLYFEQRPVIEDLILQGEGQICLGSVTFEHRKAETTIIYDLDM